MPINKSYLIDVVFIGQSINTPSLTHQTNFRLFETIFLEDLLLIRQAIQYPSIFLNINVHVLIIYYLCIELISYNTTMPVKYNHILLDVIV